MNEPAEKPSQRPGYIDPHIEAAFDAFAGHLVIPCHLSKATRL